MAQKLNLSFSTKAQVYKDIELSWSGATIETSGKSCIENEMMHNGALTQSHIISFPANVSGWSKVQVFNLFVFLSTGFFSSTL